MATAVSLLLGPFRGKAERYTAIQICIHNACAYIHMCLYMYAYIFKTMSSVLPYPIHHHQVLPALFCALFVSGFAHIILSPHILSIFTHLSSSRIHKVVSEFLTHITAATDILSKCQYLFAVSFIF